MSGFLSIVDQTPLGPSGPQNSSSPDHTLTYEEIYGRPMVIMRNNPVGNDSSRPRVQVYLDPTADVEQYLLNPIQFPAVIHHRPSSALETGTYSEQPFPLLGRGSLQPLHFVFFPRHSKYKKSKQ